MTSTPLYRGRFAPTPSGPLHFGSLIAAVGSYLRAHSLDGEWLLRIEDLDPPREVPGAADAIIRTLADYGFEWDGPVVYQSQRADAYTVALESLATAGHAYPCGCSRKEILAHARIGPAGPIYPGTCRAGLAGRRGRAWRVRCENRQIGFCDALQGEVSCDLDANIGDFTIRRADGYFAYHLALVVDDAFAGITEVVRGQDLLACTAPQIHLQSLLGLPVPDYMHLPIVVNRHGQKLSKQTHAPPLNPTRASAELVAALDFLGQQPPTELQSAPAARVWEWAHAHWQEGRLPRLSWKQAVDTV